MSTFDQNLKCTQYLYVQQYILNAWKKEIWNQGHDIHEQVHISRVSKFGTNQYIPIRNWSYDMQNTNVDPYPFG